MMAISFPFGAYVMFDTDIGNNVTFQIPAAHIALFGAESYSILPQYIQLGDLFMVFWLTYVVFFSIALVGPKRDVFVSLKERVLGVMDTPNYMVHALSWFSVLVLASVAIDTIQVYTMGLEITPPDIGNDLVQFYLVTASPLTEEVLYRVLLVGLPLFAIYTHRISLGFLAKSLWHPGHHLHIHDNAKRAIVVIFITGIIFGVSHVMYDDSWSAGKMTQAAISGIILGYVYYRYGFACALLVHWATNYFVYSYGHIVAYIGEWGIQEAFRQPFFDTIQIIFIITGAITVTMMVERRIILRARQT